MSTARTARIGLASEVELPPHEHPEADDPAVVDGDPRRRRPEGVLRVLPSEEPGVLVVGHPAERRLQEREHGRFVARFVPSQLDVLAAATFMTPGGCAPKPHRRSARWRSLDRS